MLSLLLVHTHGSNIITLVIQVIILDLDAILENYAIYSKQFERAKIQNTYILHQV